jgi:uncharacterized protein YggE
MTSLLMLVVLGLGLCLGTGPATAANADADRGTLLVSGEARITTAPDRARFDVGVVNEGKVADVVLADNSVATERLLGALRGAGIALERIQTRGVRLAPIWSSRPRDADDRWRPAIVGYRAENRVEVATAALDGVGRLLARAVDAGANDLSGVRFELADDGEARAAAIRTATARAMAEARVLAEAAGVTLGPIVELSLDPAAPSMPRPMMMDMRMAAMAESSAVPIEAGEIEIEARVSVQFLIDP